MSTVATKKAWKHREETARLLAQAVAQQRQIRERLLRYRAESARPEDAKGMLPQEIAAANADVSTRQWQRWESGERMPHLSNLEKVADKLGIPVAEFYTAAPTTDDTPDLLSSLNGDVPEDLQAQLDEIKRDLSSAHDKLDAVLSYLDVEATHERDAAASAQESATRPTRRAAS